MDSGGAGNRTFEAYRQDLPRGGYESPGGNNSERTVASKMSNLYLNEVDRMLERAREVTGNGKYTAIEYARFADDLVILIDAYKRHDWLIGAVERRLARNSASCRLKSMMKRAV